MMARFSKADPMRILRLLAISLAAARRTFFRAPLHRKPYVALTKARRLLLTGRLLYCGAVAAYLGLLIIMSKYGLPLKKGCATAGYVVLRLKGNGGNTIFQLKPWQADLFHFLEFMAALCLLTCAGIWFYVRKIVPSKTD
jgi:hypothetical protein